MKRAETKYPVSNESTLRYKLALLGFFLSPMVLLRPVTGFGFSVADFLLIVSGVFILVAPGGSPTIAQRTWFPYLGLPALLIISGLLLAGLLEPGSRAVSTFATVADCAFVLLFLPAVLVRASPDFVEQAIKFFVWGAAFSVALGLVLLVALPSAYAAFRTSGVIHEEVGRLGLFTGVGSIARLAAVTLPLLYWLYAKRLISPLSAGIVFGFLAMAVLASRSGGGTLVFVATTLALTLSSVLARLALGKSPKARGSAVLALLGGAGLALLLLTRSSLSNTAILSGFQERIVDPLSSGGLYSVGSAEYRLELNAQAWDLISESPLLGIGSGAWYDLTGYYAYPHSVPLVLWLDGGLLAVVGLAMVVVALATLTIRRVASDPVLVATGLTSLVALALVLAFQASAFGRGVWIPLLLVFVLLMPVKIAEPRSKQRLSVTRLST